MNILCLIINSDPAEQWREIYDCHKSFWHKCFDACPWVDGFFMRSEPDLAAEHDVRHRSFRVRGAEDWGTVFHKTRRAIEILLEDRHDYVVQTNVTSLFDFLTIRASTLSERSLYTGSLVDGSYATGSGMLLSSDVARMLTEPYGGELPYWDDDAIGRILRSRGVQPENRDMFIYDFSKGIEQVDRIEVGRHIHYRFRDYSDQSRALEPDAKKAVFEKVYGKTLQESR